MSHHSPTVAAAIIYAHLQMAKAHGIDIDAVTQRIGLDQTMLLLPGARLRVQQGWAMWEEFAAMTQDEQIGLKLSRYCRLNGLGVLGYMMMNAPTLSNALFVLTQYERLTADVPRFVMRQEEGAVVLAIQPSALGWHPAEQYVADFIMSAVKRVFDFLRGQDVPMIQGMGFHYGAPQHDPRLLVHRATFGSVPFRFDEAETYCVLDRQLLELPVMGANPNFFKFFEQQGRELLAQLWGDRTSDRVRQILAVMLHGQLPTVKDIANRLMLSPRSLQYQLKAEGTSFSQLLDEVRQDLAATFLERQGLTKSEVAYLLGFSDLSAFSRALKRWEVRSLQSSEPQR